MSLGSITSEQMYAIEEKASSLLRMPRFLMMENAGGAVADFLAAKFPRNLKTKRILAVCGTGNNGGDGLVAARHLAGRNVRPCVALLGPSANIRTEEAIMNWGIAQRMKDSIQVLPEDETLSKIAVEARKADVIIDAIFGTGIKGEIREPFSLVIDMINASRAYVLAVDVPSGLDPNTGAAAGTCVKADATVTFHRLKSGMKRSSKYTGPITVARIGIPPEAEEGIVRT